MERDERDRIGGDGRIPSDGRQRTASRRRLLGTGAALGAAALAGCLGPFDGGDGGDGGTGTGSPELDTFRGSGAQVGGRPELSGVRIDDLPPLEGSLDVYIGGGEGGLYLDLLEILQDVYPDFGVVPRQAPSAQLANTIITEVEGGGSEADLFWSIDAGSLGAVADAGATVQLPADVVENVPENFRPDRQWVGVAGRARSIPYNTEQFSADEIPDDVMALATDDRFSGGLGWAPTYGAFQAFVTAMRVLEGRETTKEWLEGILDGGVTEYANEFLVSDAAAVGETGAGFANHYYALRVKAARPSAPVDLAFTRGDAGALINASAVGVVEGTGKRELAQRLVRHLLTVEAQEFFATRTFAYPMVEDHPPVGGLPTIDELETPDLDLAKLSDVEPTLELLQEVGVL
ncbi:iron ABC transporter substrate-binding protein [Halobacteriales archaeon QS_8_69_26]|nr:MAG: iron ABC transporter substrate-binding protein [Halobacteriales archaeon QS_8_69_26]